VVVVLVLVVVVSRPEPLPKDKIIMPERTHKMSKKDGQDDMPRLQQKLSKSAAKKDDPNAHLLTPPDADVERVPAEMVDSNPRATDVWTDPATLKGNSDDITIPQSPQSPQSGDSHQGTSPVDAQPQAAADEDKFQEPEMEQSLVATKSQASAKPQTKLSALKSKILKSTK